MTEPLIYTIRPDGTALWLPAELCSILFIKRGQRLTPEIYRRREIQDLLSRRIIEQEARKAK